MTDPDEIADVADRLQRASDFEFEIEWGALTDEERDVYMALMGQRRAHGQEVLEALVENVRILRLLFAWREGAITALEFVERVRGAVPDPLAQQRRIDRPRARGPRPGVQGMSPAGLHVRGGDHDRDRRRARRAGGISSGTRTTVRCSGRCRNGRSAWRDGRPCSGRDPDFLEPAARRSQCHCARENAVSALAGRARTRVDRT